MNGKQAANDRSEQKYRLIVESARDYAIFTLDLGGRVTTWNSGARRLLGYSEQEILGKSGRKLFTPSDRQKKAPERECATARRYGRSGDERWHLKKDGTRFWASGMMMAIRGKDNKVTGFLKILRDMTQQKLVEAADRRFSTLVQNVHDYALVLLDQRGIVTEWNAGAARLKGYSHKEIIGRHFRVFYTQEDQRNKQPEKEMARAIRKGRSETEGWRVRKDGSRFWVNEIITPIYDKSQKLLGFSKISRDLTERREAEEALRMMNESLERRVQERTAEMEENQSRLRTLAIQLSRTQEEERRTIAADIHDNLAQLLALSEMRLSGIKKRLDDTYLLKSVTDVERYIDQAIKYTRSLMLDLSPPVLQKRELLPAIQWLASDMRTHGLKTSVRDDGYPKPVSEDVFNALFQGVRELLFNVLKHAGTDKVSVALSRAGNLVKITVKDRGRGCEVDRAVTHSKRGFGLFTLNERLRSIGGTLDLKSTAGKGTTVVVTASLKGNFGTANPAKAKSARPTDRHIRVLIVDDHKMMRDGLRKIVEEQPDIEIVGEAADGEIGVAMVSRLKPDIVLMDVNMPRLDGIEATRRITLQKNAPAVIGLSIHEDKDTEQSLRKAGACAYLSKRETADKLYTTIRQWAHRLEKTLN